MLYYLVLYNLTSKVQKLKLSKNVIHSKGVCFSRWHCLWWRNTISNRQKDEIKDFPSVLTDTTGRFRGKPIKIQLKSNAVPVIQAPRRIPLHYRERAKAELEKIISEDIICVEEPGTFLSKLVITDKKGIDKIRVTLDCQEVNKSIYPTHEPIPTVEELTHELKGSDRFSSLNFTNCYYARKLYAFRTLWGVYRYKSMVMGASPASSEIQERFRETARNCHNIVHIEDDIDHCSRSWSTA